MWLMDISIFIIALSDTLITNDTNPRKRDINIGSWLIR